MKKKSLIIVKKKSSNISSWWLLVVFALALPLILWAVNQNTEGRSKAASNVYVFGNAMKLNGTDACAQVTTPHSDDLRLLREENYTIDGWFKYTGVSGSNQQFIVARGVRSNVWPGSFTVGIKDSKLNFTAFRLVGTTFEKSTVIGSTSISTNRWQHFAAIKDGSNLRLYLHGVEDALPSPFTPTTTSTIEAEIGLGCQEKFTGTSVVRYGFFPGELDDIRISLGKRYSGSFLPPNVPFVVDRNTVALWPLDESTGTTYIYDATNNNYDAYIAVNTVQFVPSTIVVFSPTPTPTPTPSPKPRPSPTQTPTPTPTPEPTPPPPQPNRTFRVETLLQNADGKQVSFPLVNARTIVRFTNANGNPQKPLICYQGNNDGQCPVAKYCMSNGSMTLPIKPGGLPCTGAAPGWYSTQWDKTVNVSGKTYELISPTNCDDSICTQEEKILISGKQLHQGIYRQLP